MLRTVAHWIGAGLLAGSLTSTAAAQELNAVGHEVTVYERDEAPGGLIRFGVPDAKLEKWIIDRRVKVLAEEGIHFSYGVDVGGAGLPADELRARHDAVVIATGSRIPRELEVPGRELDGVHMAMDYLYIRNRYVASITEDGVPGPEPEVPIVAEGKDVVVIGGGDTGMDCISNANREGAKSAILLDVYPEIPVGGRYDDTPWPMPLKRSFGMTASISSALSIRSRSSCASGPIACMRRSLTTMPSMPAA